MEIKLRETEKMDDDEDEVTGKKDTRDGKKKRQHKKETSCEDYTKESFKKMKEEIDQMRRRETERAKELEELKKRIEENKRSTEQNLEFDLDFDRDAYLSKGFIDSAKWIKEVVSKNLLEKLKEEKNSKRFESMTMIKKASTHLGIRTCARYNRGEICHFGKLHSTHKPESPWSQQERNSEDPNRQNHETYRDYRLRKSDDASSSIQDRLGKKNEVRIHACTLCMEAFGTANGHNVLNCPWILKKSWP